MVSVIGDVYKDKWKPEPWYPNPSVYIQGVTREEFDALQKEVLALKELLEAANKFDKATGQPHCEMEEKVELLRKVAEAVGVNLDSILKPTI